MWANCEAYNKKWADHFHKKSILTFTRIPGKLGHNLVGISYKLANKIVRFN